MAPVADLEQEVDGMSGESCDRVLWRGRGGRKLGVCFHLSMSRRLSRASESVFQHTIYDFAMERIETSDRVGRLTYLLKGCGGIAAGVPIRMVLQCKPFIRSDDHLDRGSLVDFENHVKVLCNLHRRHRFRRWRSSKMLIDHARRR